MSLHKILTQFRPFTNPTYHIKTRPTNLQLTLLDERASEDSKLLEFYVETVLREEPTVVAAGLTHSAELRECLRTSLGSRHTVQLTDVQGGGVVGAASGGPLTEATLAALRSYAEEAVREERTRQLVGLWLAALSESGVPDTWLVSSLAVAPHMRRLGLARFLVAQHSRLATKQGCGAVTLLSTADATALLLQKAGYRSMGEKSLSSQMDPWLPRPHPNIQLFYKTLYSDKNFDTWLL